jgi:hypothetical protein
MDRTCERFELLRPAAASARRVPNLKLNVDVRLKLNQYKTLQKRSRSTLIFMHTPFPPLFSHHHSCTDRTYVNNLQEPSSN